MDIIDRLLSNNEPSVVWKTKRLILGIDDQNVRSEIPKSSRVKKLLSEVNKDGLIPHPVYSKWYGSHWILMHLAELDYPENDPEIWPMVDYTLEKWFRATENKGHLTMIDSRPRRCASQEANICWSALKLGFMDDRIHELINRLIAWQWDDGGWNCDKNPSATKSSFHESAIPLRALSIYADKTSNKKALESAKKASEIFLKRKLYKKQNSNDLMFNRIDLIGIPSTWHYDFFFGLKVMAESGFLNDPRCKDALDLLESKRLPDDGFPAEYRYYSLWDGKKEKRTSGTSLVDWSPTSKKQFNPFVTVNALFILKTAGRI